MLDKNNILKSKKLYLVTDYNIEFNDLYKRVYEALSGGCRLIQYRAKNKSTRNMIMEGDKLKRLCDEFNALFIVNDRIDVALASRAHGVHLGQDDMDILRAREILGEDYIIGITVHNKREALDAINSGANYLGVGAFFKTNTKKDVNVIDRNIASEIRRVSNIPIYGIGGITLENLNKEEMNLVYGVAVISDILNNENIRKRCEDYVGKLEKQI